MRTLLICAAIAVVGTACDKADPVGNQRAGLVAFQSCEELETYIEDTAVAQMADMTWGPQVMYDGARGGAPAPEAATGAPSADNAAPDYSQTNTQVAGVDEADFVKTDGFRTFYLAGRQLMVLKTWPAAETALVSKTEIEGWPTEMFLADGKLVVFSGVPQYAYDDRIAIGMPAPDYYYGYWGGDAIKVTVFDVATDTPVLKDSWYLAGGYASSRRIGTAVRLVLSASLRWPDNLLYYWPGVDYADADAWAEAQAKIREYNEKIIRARSLADWLPKSYVMTGGQKIEVPPQCTSYYRPSVAARLGLAVIATFDLAQPQAGVNQIAALAEVGEVYANAQSLYLATPSWGWSTFGSTDTGEKTYLHKFSLESTTVAYRASGGVPGHIVDQFSLDEHEGYLRIATTRWNNTGRGGDVVSVGGTGGAPSPSAPGTENHVFVLAESDGELKIVGDTGILAPDERIYSARFDGTKGFVVTYRQVDPLFTLDLSDPAAPKKVGELKIPGFSTYIHLLDATHLLTIGNETDSVNGTTRTGLSLQIFDVSDMAHPALTAKQLIGTQSSWSQALYDHKAFNFFEKTGMLAIPFTDWGAPTDADYWTGFVSTLKVFKIDAAGGITPMGEVDHSDLYRQNNQSNWYWWYGPEVRRSVMVENFVYSFSYAGVKVNDTANLAAAPVAVVALPPEAPAQSK